MTEPINPYASPTVEPARPSFGRRATLTRRFGARMIDNAVFFAILLCGFAIGDALGGLESEAARDRVAFGLTSGAWVVLEAAQVALLTRRGQTLGKALLGLRIVTREGGAAGFVRVVLLRRWPWAVLGVVPLFGALLSIFDGVWLVVSGHFAAHDLVAGTRVIDVRGGRGAG